MIHDLKIRTVWFERVKSGEKRYELRKHDRDYQVGDVLQLTEVNEFGSRVETDGEYSTLDVRVLHVLDGRHADGIDDDYCLLSIEPVVAEEVAR